MTNILDILDCDEEDIVKMTSLNLSNKELKEIPNISMMINLRYLDLSQNKIEKIEENAFNSLINLKELYLYHNQLTKIDKNIFVSLSKLKCLSLFCNQIKEIEENAFDSLSNLRTLCLNDNQITKIENNAFNSLIKLEHLSIYCNQLTTLPLSLLLCKKLKYIDISNTIFNTGPVSINGVMLDIKFQQFIDRVEKKRRKPFRK